MRNNQQFTDLMNAFYAWRKQMVRNGAGEMTIVMDQESFREFETNFMVIWTGQTDQPEPDKITICGVNIVPDKR